MIAGVESSPRGQIDALPNETPKPCARRTWCKLDAGHEPPCVEVNRPPRPVRYVGPARVAPKP